MNPFEILQRHYDPASELYRIVTVHSVLVAQQAWKIAMDYRKRCPGVEVDLRFVTDAALLHDIGVRACHHENLPSDGTEPYIRHGVVGREILEAEGLPRHALVCERHVGAGITEVDVRTLELPLPLRDYLPVSIEEKIICVADKFYSKTPTKLFKRKKARKIEASLAKHGPGVLDRWITLIREVLGESPSPVET